MRYAVCLNIISYINLMEEKISTRIFRKVRKKFLLLLVIFNIAIGLVIFKDKGKNEVIILEKVKEEILKSSDPWHIEQSRRRDFLRQKCDYYQMQMEPPSLQELSEQKSLLSNILVDKNRKMLFCYIPQVADTEWKQIFTQLLKANESSSDSGVSSAILKPLEHSNFQESEIVEMLRDFKKFIFVRHPLERLLATYSNKFVPTDDADARDIQATYGSKMIKEVRRKVVPKGQGLQLKEFLRYLTVEERRPDVPGFHEYWRTYFDLCHPCSIQYDYIGKYESLVEDANKILDEFKVNSNIRFPMKSDYKKLRSSLLGIIKTIPVNSLKGIYEVYIYDYHLFEYEKLS